MTDHTSSNPQPSTDLRARNDRYYLAQCVKDETMGESVAGAVLKLREQPATVVHFNGSFHSDFAEGTVASTARRLSGRRLLVVSIVTVPDLDAVAPVGDDLHRADYVVYTLR